LGSRLGESGVIFAHTFVLSERKYARDKQLILALPAFQENVHALRHRLKMPHCGSRRERRTYLAMHVVKATAGRSRASAYRELNAQLAALFAGERSGMANAANMAALLYQVLPELNWAGFYFLQGGELVLGPFQGRVACVRIALGRGVCGTAAQRRKTIIVPDVNQFPGHIACDASSRSEIVVPLLGNGGLLGVLDLDSPRLSRFDDNDEIGLNAAVKLLLEASEMGRLGD
jgi:L-methionine (R)-S-oxide reductase